MASTRLFTPQPFHSPIQMICIQCMAPSIFNLLVFTIVIMGILTLGGIGFGISRVVEYERRRRLRVRLDSDECATSLGAPMIGAT